MDVWITEPALQSYLDLRKEGVFSAEEYRTILRPDAELLHSGLPFRNPKFKNSKFWSPAVAKNGEVIKGGFKMKWHNIGPGKAQLRLLVGLTEEAAFLFEAYVKSSPAVDYRYMAKLKIRMRDLVNGNFVTRGRL